MNVYIVNSKISKRDYDGIVLTEKDFHPCRSFFIDHPEIKPESNEYICIQGVVERCEFLRCVFKYCDYMLSPNGILEIKFCNAYFSGPSIFIRSQTEWMYELSLTFKDRIHLFEKKSIPFGNFKFKKLRSCLAKDDIISRWSFGIVSNGKDNESVLNIISQIINFDIPEYEILICGPEPSNDLPERVRILDETMCYTDLRIPISRKKNLIIDNAIYDNLVILHDRILFPENWYEKMKDYGNYYDMLCTPILNIANQNRRMLDWIRHVDTFYKPNIISRLLFNNTTLYYNEWSKDIFVNGGFFQIKRLYAQNNPLNTNLNWGEKEDVDFSIRQYYDGILMSFNTHNKLYSKPVRFKGSRLNNSIIEKVAVLKGRFKRLFMELSKWREFNRIID